MIIIPTTQAMHLANKLRGSKSFRIIVPGFNRDGKRYFPDGEMYAKIPQASSLKGTRVIVLHTGQPHPNEGLVELELILQILKDAQVKNLEVFFAYFPYGMQDEVFTKGETNIAGNLIEKLYTYYDIRTIYIIDAHFAGKKWIEKYPIRHLSAVPQLVETAMEDFGKDLLFLSPDEGGKRRTKIRSMQKKRKNSFEIEIRSSAIVRKAIQNKMVAVVDDLIETGGTLDHFYDECKRAGAKDLIALITHGVLQSGMDRIKKKYRKMYLTNTINRKEANVDVVDFILKGLSSG